MWAPPPPEYESSHTGRNIVIAIVIIALMVVAAAAVTGGIFFFFAPISRTTVVTQHHSQTVRTIVGGLVRVENRSYEYYEFTVPPTAFSVHVSGGFTVSGGTGNNIQVFVMYQPYFVNWQNNQTYRPYYNSGRLNNSTFDISLPPGETDVLVYSNMFSSSPKDVQASVTLFFSQ